MAVRLSLLLGFTLAVLHGAASAQQQAFSRETRQLHYVWQYEDAATQAFTLRLPDSQILPVWTTWHAGRAQEFVLSQLIRNARQRYPGVTFNLRRTADGDIVDYQSFDERQIEQIKTWLPQQQEILFNAWLAQHYYKRHGDDSSHLIRPDHTRIAADSSTGLRELARTLQRVIIASAPPTLKQRYQQDERALVVAGLLNFVQSIPYDPLQSADGLRGVAFLMPEQVLTQNRGDCDSKSVLMMALLKALYPELTQAIVYIPEHAFLAVALPPPTGNEQTLQIGDTLFLPLEVAGPAEIPPGVTGEKSRLAILNQQYQYNLLPGAARRDNEP